MVATPDGRKSPIGSLAHRLAPCEEAEFNSFEEIPAILSDTNHGQARDVGLGAVFQASLIDDAIHPQLLQEMSMSQIQIAVMVGSLRKDSFNRKLAHEIPAKMDGPVCRLGQKARCLM